MGIERTKEKILRTYYIPLLDKAVREWVKNCDAYWRAKHTRHAPYGRMQTVPISERPWESIAMDFIVKLPESREPGRSEKYDSIWVIVDRLTKYAYFIAFQEKTSAEDLAYHFQRVVVSNHGLPREIVTDRGTLFTSKFWETLTAMMGIKRKMSTAYYP